MSEDTLSPVARYLRGEEVRPAARPEQPEAQPQAQPQAPARQTSGLPRLPDLAGAISAGVYSAANEVADGFGALLTQAERADDAARNAPVPADPVRAVLDPSSPRFLGAAGDVLRYPNRLAASVSRALRSYGVLEDDGELPDIPVAALTDAENFGPIEQTVETLAQAVAGYVAGGRAVRALTGGPAKTRVGQIGEAMAGGAIGDFLAFDGNEDRLSDLIEAVPALRNPVTAYLAADENDPELEGRMKAVLEGAGLGAIVDSVTLMLRATKAAKAGDAEGYAQATEELEQVARAADESVRAEARAAEPQPTAEVQPDAPEAGTALVPQGQVARVEEPEAAPRPDETALEPSPEGRPGGGEQAFRGSEIDDDGVIRVTEDDARAVLKEYGDLLQQGPEAVLSRIAERRPTDLNLSKYDTPEKMKALLRTVSDVFAEQTASVRGAPRSQAGVVRDGRKLAAQIVRDTGGDSEMLLRNMMGVASEVEKLPETMMAYALMTRNMQEQLYAAAVRLANDESEEALSAYLQRLEAYVNAQSATVGIASNAGRLLNLQRVVKKKDARLARELDLLVDPTIVSRIDPTGRSKTALDALKKHAQRVRATGGSRRAISRLTRQSILRRSGNALIYMQQSNLLSSVPTHVANVGGGVYNMIEEPLTRVLGGIGRRDREMFLEGVDQAAGTIYGSLAALRYSFNSFLRGHSTLVPTKFAEGYTGNPLEAGNFGINSRSIPGRVMNAAALLFSGPMRVIAATDDAVAYMAAHGRLYALAMREARAQKIPSDKVQEFVEKFIDDSFETENGVRRLREDAGFDERRYAQQLTAAAQARGINTPEALDEFVNEGLRFHRERNSAAGVATRATFQDAPPSEGLSLAVEQVINSWWPLRIILFPFVRTPLAIVRRVVDSTPGLQLVSRRAREELSGRYGAEAQAQAVARTTVAGTMMTWAMMEAANGNLVGYGPTDPNERQQWLAAGGQPYSIRVGGNWVSLSRIDPMGFYLGMAADVYRRVDMESVVLEGEEPPAAHDWAAETLGATMIGLSELLREKTFFTSVSNFMALADREEDRAAANMDRFVTDLQASLIPYTAALNRLNPDPVIRDARTFQDVLNQRLQGDPENVDARYDVLFRQRTRDEGYLERQVSPFARRASQPDPVMEEILRLQDASNAEFLPIRRRVDKTNVDLTAIPAADGKGTVYGKLQELVGTIRSDGMTLEQRLQKLIESDTYRNRLSDGDDRTRGSRAEAISKVRNAYIRAAKAELTKPRSPYYQPALVAALKDDARRREAALEGRPMDPDVRALDPAIRAILDN